MADVRAPFPTLVDASGVASVLSKSLSGDAASGKIGSTAFAYQDSSGALVLPQLTVAGAIPVDTGGMGTPVSGQGTVGGSLTNVTVATATLVATKVYSYIEVSFSSYNDALAEIVWNDNGTPTILGWILLGPGQFTGSFSLKNLSFTAGATGTQELNIIAKNLIKASDLYATVSASQGV